MARFIQTPQGFRITMGEAPVGVTIDMNSIEARSLVSSVLKWATINDVPEDVANWIEGEQ